MDYLKFGTTALKPSKLGFDCNAIASVSTTCPPSEVKRTLLKAFNAGVNFFDTANIYGQGGSEKMLGQIFKSRREDIIICSKGGQTLSKSQKLIRLIKPVVNPLIRGIKSTRRAKSPGTVSQTIHTCFEPDYLYACIADSLQRLKSDYIDIYLLHGTSQELVQNQQVFTMLDNAKNKGLIRYYGISTTESNHALYCLENYNIDCIQIPVNLLRQDMINEVIPRAKSKGVGIISRQPLANDPLFSNSALTTVAHRLHRSADHIALQYLLGIKDSGVILADMICQSQLAENLTAVMENSLNEFDMAYLKNETDKATLKSEILYS